MDNIAYFMLSSNILLTMLFGILASSKSQKPVGTDIIIYTSLAFLAYIFFGYQLLLEISSGNVIGSLLGIILVNIIGPWGLYSKKMGYF